MIAGNLQKAVGKGRYNDSTRVSPLKALLESFKLQDKSSLQANARKATVLLNVHSLRLEAVQMYADGAYKAQTETRSNQGTQENELTAELYPYAVLLPEGVQAKRGEKASLKPTYQLIRHRH